MIDHSFAEGRSPIHRLDPRLRIIVALSFAVLLATSTRMTVSIFGLLAGALLVALADLPNGPLAARLAAVNAFMLFLWLFLPFTHPGREVVLRIGSMAATWEGVLYVAQITLKCNAIVLTLTALLSTIEITPLGHALHHLRVPGKLVHLYMFTVRYFDVIHREYHRLMNAAKVRGFRPRMNMHTYRTYGYLAGMLLVNSFDRAERVMAAMKCRGFQGRFYVLKHFTMTSGDAAFGAAALLALLALGWMQWNPTLP